MLLQESLWYKDVIRRRLPHGARVVNIGSSTKHYVEVLQPYIKQNVIDELTAKECVVTHVDIKQTEGVDMVGDIMEPDFAERVRTLEPDAIICGSVLEQVSDHNRFAQALETLLKAGALLIVSVPHSFPYHEDPIDTLYRPDVADLEAAFSRLELVEGRIVSAGRYFFILARRLSFFGKIWYFIKRVIKYILLRILLRGKEAQDVGWSFREVSATCAIFTTKP